MKSLLSIARKPPERLWLPLETSASRTDFGLLRQSLRLWVLVCEADNKKERGLSQERQKMRPGQRYVNPVFFRFSDFRGFHDFLL